MFERFTDRARKILALANQEAQRFNHEYIGSEHILLGLLKEGGGVGANVLKNRDIDLRKLRQSIEKLIKSGPEMVTMGKLPQTPRAKKVIEYAIHEARNLNHNYVGSEHILLGLIREQQGLAAQVLHAAGVTLEAAREEICALIAAGSYFRPEEAWQLSEQQHPLRPSATLTLSQALTSLLLLDLRAKSLESEKDAAVHSSDYDRALKARDDLRELLAEKEDLIRDIIARDISVAQVLNALSCLDPQSPTATATLILAMIRSDPILAARLGTLVPAIERALENPPANSRES